MRNLVPGDTQMQTRIRVQLASLRNPALDREFQALIASHADGRNSSQDTNRHVQDGVNSRNVNITGVAASSVDQGGGYSYNRRNPASSTSPLLPSNITSTSGSAVIDMGLVNRKTASTTDDRISDAARSVQGYIQMGQASLIELREQSEIMQSARRRLASVGSSLGLDRATIRLVERAHCTDWLVLLGCIVLFVWVASRVV